MNANPSINEALPRATYLLTACQAINLTAAVISVTVAGLVGLKLAPSAAWATVPYGMQFAAMAITTYPAAALMRRYGRKPGFLLGSVLLLVAGLIGYYAVVESRFVALVIAHVLLGAYVAFANFYRFAATDRVPAPLRSRALSLVVAGGVVAAVTGPLVSIGLNDVKGFAPFSLCYASFVVLALLTMGLMAVWRSGGVVASTASALSQASEKVMSMPIAVAIFTSASAYLIMNLLMVQASLVMEQLCVSFKANTFAVQGHVLAMFVPSFFTGRLMEKVGQRNTLLAGFALIIAAVVVGVINPQFNAMVIGLLLLGVGWNFSYIGGGALLANSLTDHNRHHFQGLNDSIIAISATVGAFAPALLQAMIGWRNTNLLCLAICVVGCVLVWKLPRQREALA